MPLTIRSAPLVEGRKRPYDDEVGADGFLIYRYRGTNPQHSDNVGLRRAMQRQVPLLYLCGVVPGWYRPVWPVYVQHDDPVALAFHVAVDDLMTRSGSAEQDPTASLAADGGIAVRRRYITASTQLRLHQSAFRMRVLRAYQETCAICRLRHPELLEAAHIVPDHDPRGEPTVTNGVSLCVLHHTAFDRHIVGIRPDYRIEIRTDILAETDGPMLKHGLQGFQGGEIHKPRRPWLRRPGVVHESGVALGRGIHDDHDEDDEHVPPAPPGDRRGRGIHGDDADDALLEFAGSPPPRPAAFDGHDKIRECDVALLCGTDVIDEHSDVLLDFGASATASSHGP